MTRYAIRRILWAIPTLFGVSLVVFLLTTLMPEVPGPSRELMASAPDVALEEELSERAFSIFKRL